MANPAPTINQINAFNATQGTTIDFNIIGGTELIRSNRIYIYDLSDNSLICTHLYVSTESIHELPANTDGSIVYESGKSSADFVNGAQYYAQIQTYTDTNGTQGGSGLSVAKMFWCLVNPTLTITTIPSTISTTSYNISATYTDTSASVVSNIIQQYQFNLYSATGSLLQSSGVVVGSGTQQGTSAVYDISYNFTGLNVGSSYYVTVDVTTTQGMSVTTQSNTFTVSIDTPTLGEATVVNNACDGYISVTSNLSGEYGGSGSGEIVSFETDSEDIFTKLQVDLEPTQEGTGTPSPSNVRPIRGHGGVDVTIGGKNLFQTTAESKTENGLTWTVNEDGTITVTGTPTAYTNLNVGRAYVNGIDDNVTISQIDDNSNVMWDTIAVYDNTNQLLYTVTAGSVNAEFTVNLADYPTADYIEVYIKRKGSVATNTTVKIQVERGTTATEWEPYQQPQTITQDFNVSLTPTSTDTTPYSFKAVGDVYGDRLEDKIVGGTVAWNQMVRPFSDLYWRTEAGVTATYNNKEVVFTSTVNNNGVATQFHTVSKPSHVVLYTVVAKASEDCEINLRIGGNVIAFTEIVSLSTNYTTANVLGKTSQKTVDGLTYITTTSSSINKEISVKNAQVFDLTQMFGSTIADYIYSLEQSQAGAGVAWFKKLFPNDYYAYNAGELLSVGGLQSHDTVGFNLFDEETYFTTNGFTKNSEGYWTRVGYPADHPHLWDNKCGYTGRVCIKHTSYRSGGTNASFRFRYTDGTLSFSFIPDTSTTEQTLSASGKVVEYIDYDTSASPTIFMKDVCINLSDPSRNGEYEPYEKHSYPLDSSLTLRGIPKLDASNNLYYDGDEYTSDGKVKRNKVQINLADLDFVAYPVGSDRTAYTAAGAVTTYGVKTIQSVVPNAFCSNGFIPTYQNASRWNAGEFVFTLAGATLPANSIAFITANGAYASAEAFKTAMANHGIIAELATPTTETAQAYTNPQIVSKYGTLEYVTNSIVPVGHKTTYLTRDIFGGYVDLISGTLVVTHGYVDLGTLTYSKSSSTSGGFLGTLTLHYPYKGDNEMLCSVYKFDGVGNNASGYYGADGTIRYYYGSEDTAYYEIYIHDTSKASLTADQFKEALNGEQLWIPLAAPQTYQLTPQQVNTLVGTNNVWSEQGNIELSYHIPITNLLVKRQDVDDVSGGWLTLYSQPITQASDMDFTFIDFLNQYGKTYKYALVPLLTQTQSGVEVEVEGGYTVSDEVQSVFDGVFIADSTGSQKCKANVGYGNVDMNQVVGSITPIGAKYPIIITNSHNQYHNGSISGTIVPDDYYFNGNLSRIDMVNKRNELEQFLTNKRVKVIKDWNGNIWLVMIVGNVSCTFNNNYGMGIVSFSTNWTEVGDPTNQQDLQATGLINVGGV